MSVGPTTFCTDRLTIINGYWGMKVLFFHKLMGYFASHFDHYPSETWTARQSPKLHYRPVFPGLYTYNWVKQLPLHGTTSITWKCMNSFFQYTWMYVEKNVDMMYQTNQSKVGENDERGNILCRTYMDVEKPHNLHW